MLVDSLLPATALAKKRDATAHAQDATASAVLALAEDKRRKEDKRHKEDKQCQEEAAAKQCRAGVNLHLFPLANSYE